MVASYYLFDCEVPSRYDQVFQINPLEASYYLFNCEVPSRYDQVFQINPLEDLSEDDFIQEFRINKTDDHSCNLLRNELQCIGNCQCGTTLNSIYLRNYFNPSLFHRLFALHWSRPSKRCL